MCVQSEWTNRYEMMKLGEKEITSLFFATQLDSSMLEQERPNVYDNQVHIWFLPKRLMRLALSKGIKNTQENQLNLHFLGGLYANCCVGRYVTVVCDLPVGLCAYQTVRYMLASGLQTFWQVKLPLD